MAGIKNPSMRDYLPTKMQRFQSGGLLGLLSGPTQQEKDIAQAYANFAQGLQPQAELSGINLPVTGEVANLPASQGQADYQGLLNNLVASGPSGLGQAKVLAGMLGQGKSQRPISPTATALSIRASGNMSGIPSVDNISPEDAMKALRNIEGIVAVPGVDEKGNLTTRYISKVDALGTGYGGKYPSQLGTKPSNIDATKAGKINLLSSGIQDIDAASNLLFPNGLDKPVDASVVWQSASPLGGVGKGREVRQRLRNAISAKLLAQTGVTARSDELDQMVDSYIPQPMDLPNKGLPAKKINRLREFMQGTLDMTYLPKSYRERVNAHIKKNKSVNKTKQLNDSAYEELKRKAGL